MPPMPPICTAYACLLLPTPCLLPRALDTHAAQHLGGQTSIKMHTHVKFPVRLNLGPYMSKAVHARYVHASTPASSSRPRKFSAPAAATLRHALVCSSMGWPTWHTRLATRYVTVASRGKQWLEEYMKKGQDKAAAPSADDVSGVIAPAWYSLYAVVVHHGRSVTNNACCCVLQSRVSVPVASPAMHAPLPVLPAPPHEN